MTVVCRVTNGKLRWSEVEPTTGGQYQMAVTCAHCGGDLSPVTEGKVIHNAMQAGTETSAIARCAECRREWHLWVRLQPVAAGRDESACGTNAGYQRHLRAKEPTCDKCERAHGLYLTRNRESSPRTDLWEDKRAAHLAVVQEFADA